MQMDIDQRRNGDTRGHLEFSNIVVPSYFYIEYYKKIFLLKTFEDPLRASKSWGPSGADLTPTHVVYATEIDEANSIAFDIFTWLFPFDCLIVCSYYVCNISNFTVINAVL